MFKTGLLSIAITITLITTLLTSCGFHTPRQSVDLNALISTTNNNAFANELKKRFNTQAKQSFVIQIGRETQREQDSSYDTDGKISSFTLSLNVPIKVFNNDNKLLLSERLTSSIHLNTIDETQADRLQMNEAYAQLRNTMIKRLLRRLNRLNEN